MLSKKLLEVFSAFENNSVKYVILRGYESEAEIEEGMDIDLYIAPFDKLRVKKLLLSLGWYTARINCNIYPHEQFYFFSDRCYKLDIQYGIMFGNTKYQYKNESRVLSERVRVGCYYTPSNVHAFQMMLCHLVFDKNKIEEYNRLRLESILKRNQGIEDLNSKFYHELLVVIKDSEKVFRAIEENIFNLNIVNSKNCLNKSIERYFLCKKRSICNRIINRTLAVVGVDGAGKSTLINNLNSILMHRSYVQYMGDKNYEFNILNSYNGAHNWIRQVLIYINMLYRFFRFRFKYNGIIIFDRFADERHINALGKSAFIYKCLYKYLFPSPQYYIYLHCDSNISFNRKNDIQNRDVFIKMKKRFDEFYLENHQVISIDTGKLNEEEVICKVMEFINRNCIEWII